MQWHNDQLNVGQIWKQSNWQSFLIYWTVVYVWGWHCLRNPWYEFANSQYLVLIEGFLLLYWLPEWNILQPQYNFFKPSVLIQKYANRNQMLSFCRVLPLPIWSLLLARHYNTWIWLWVIGFLHSVGLATIIFRHFLILFCNLLHQVISRINNIIPLKLWIQSFVWHSRNFGQFSYLY